MPLIDSQGRLFGKINIIDLMVVCAVILVGIVGYKYVFASSKEAVYPDIFIEAVASLPEFIVQNFYIGAVEIDKNEVIANITDIEKIPKGNGNYNVYIKAKIKAKYKDEKVFFKGKPLEVNSIQTLFNLNGWNILNIDNKPKLVRSYTKKEIELKLYNQKPWVADAISNGDKEVINNKTIALIIAKKIEDAEITLLSEQASDVYIKQKYPNKDITLTIKILAQRKNNDLFFKGKKLKIGQELIINTKDATIKGIVSKIH